MRRSCAAAMALALVAFAPSALAVTGPSAVAAPPVVVDLFVTDAGGRPVAALPPAEIELREDGTPVEIVSCVGPAGGRGASSDEIERARQLTVAVLVDDTVAPAKLRAVFAKADTAAGELLTCSRSRVLIACGGANVAIRQAFTGDRGKLVRGFASLAAGCGNGAVGTGADVGSRGGASTSVGELMAALGSLPGRRALVYVAGDAPTPAAGGRRPDRSDLIHSLADKASAAGVTLYIIDASVASTRPVGRAAAGPGGGPSPGAAAAAADLRTAALATGGLAVTEGADAGAALVDAIRDFKSAWSIGFISPAGDDGQLHRLQARVTRGGVIVRARSTFLAVKDDERMTERTAAALLLGFEDDPLGIQLAVTSEAGADKEARLVTVLVTLPLGGLAFEANGVSQSSDVTLWLVARDGGGRVIRAPKAKFPISVPNDRLLAALSQTAGYAFRVPMHAGRGAVALTVRDEIGMRSSTMVVPVAAVTGPTPGVTP